MSTFSLALLYWYDRYGRTLPWRVKGKPADPYRVWVSEIMLQQTTVMTVIPYFEAFMTRWPTLQALSEAQIDDVLHLWQGLGYYTRARALYTCARILLKEWKGCFPKTEKELLQLPGIGPYTAAALLTIAFEKPAVAIDGNITRVISRYFALPGRDLNFKKEVKMKGETLLPLRRFGDYTQALMDLGAQVCTPKNPQCDYCPVSKGCQAKQQGRVFDFPERGAPRTLPVQYGDVFWVEREDETVFFQKEEAGRLLKGLLRPPFSSFTPELIETPLFPIKGPWLQDTLLVTHTFTHFKLCLRVWYTLASQLPQDLKGIWIHRRDFHAYAFSTLVQKIIRRRTLPEERH